jgi:hypothetical protein
MLLKLFSIPCHFLILSENIFPDILFSVTLSLLSYLKEDENVIVLDT